MYEPNEPSDIWLSVIEKSVGETQCTCCTRITLPSFLYIILSFYIEFFYSDGFYTNWFSDLLFVLNLCFNI